MPIYRWKVDMYTTRLANAFDAHPPFDMKPVLLHDKGLLIKMQSHSRSYSVIGLKMACTKEDRFVQGGLGHAEAEVGVDG
jgi:hypothetical protein